jgi:hypothetical protein
MDLVDAAELEFQRADLENQIRLAYDARYTGSMSDDFFYTNGGYHRATELITRLEAKLAELGKSIANAS